MATRITITAPTDLPGCVMWLDAAKGVSLDAAGKVQQWNDQSGANNHPSQASPSARPAMGTGPNGRPCVTFDGVDDILGLSVAITNPQTVFIVAKFNNSASTGTVFCGGGNIARVWMANPNSINYAGNAANQLAGTVPSTLAWHAYGITFGGVASSFVADRSCASRGNTGIAAATGIGIGGLTGFGSPHFASCSVAEIIVYNRALTDGERFLVQALLLDKYALLPARILSAPTDLVGCSLWLDAQASAIAKDGANKVSQWNDLSGLANHASNLAPATQPTYVPAILNGLPGIRMERTLDTFLDAANALLANGESEHTIFIVARRLVGAGGAGLVGALCLSTAVGSRNSSSIGWDNAAGTSWFGAAGYGLPIGDVVPAGRGALLTKRYRLAASTRSNIEGWLNATGRCTDSIAFNPGNTTASVGRGTSGTLTSISGWISSALAYRRALTDGEIYLVSQYLAKAWALFPWGRVIATPLDIADCVLYLNATLGVSQTSGNVSQWNDQSIAANHFSASGITSPILTTYAGAPVVSFDGIDDTMLAKTNIADNVSGSTIVAVCRKRTPAMGASKSVIGTQSNALYLDTNAGASWGGYSGGFKRADEQPTASLRIYSARRGPSNVQGAFKLRADGTQKGLFTTGGNDSRVTTNLSGATENVDMDLAALVIYLRSISDGELFLVEQYLKRLLSL